MRITAASLMMYSISKLLMRHYLKVRLGFTVVIPYLESSKLRPKASTIILSLFFAYFLHDMRRRNVLFFRD